ncbi:MAG TPA: radical SAM protein [Firmicutes bacterium]|nr:radical SAM protein [Bacillota bacterium]
METLCGEEPRLESSDTKDVRAERPGAESREVESPEVVRISLAAAMSLGFKPGQFYRGATLGCLNILLTYRNGCAGNCQYCGLARERRIGKRGQSFIRVAWPVYPLEQVLSALREGEHGLKRVCISMITQKRAVEDSIKVVRLTREACDLPISVLISPTVMKREDLLALKQAGAERIGVAFDLPTPELFEKIRGASVRGPHRWPHYWEIFQDALSIFGAGFVGVHLIVGLGETEREMSSMIWRVKQAGGSTHLFSFYPEAGSAMEDRPQPSASTYRRIQLVRYLMDEGLASFDNMVFDDQDRIRQFGVESELLRQVIRGGKPFMTSGCPGRDGSLACNRPYGDSMPGEDIRSYPFLPEKEDIEKIEAQLWTY